MALISLENVSKVYPHAARPALDSINLDVERGDFVFLVGASGAGKSTLLSLLLHEEEATDGSIHVAGNDLRRLSNRQVPHYRRSIGFVFQDYKLLPNKTVYENVAFALEVIGTRRSTIKSLVPQVLQAVGLEGKENRLPHELSGGEAQRVAIARAYVNHPQIILADEPTGNLDPTTSVGIMEVLDAINRQGTTIVMATHNEEIVNSMRKRVVELHNGKLVRDEHKGLYDSSTYFPDSEVEAKSKAQNSLLNVDSVDADGTSRAGQPTESIAQIVAENVTGESFENQVPAVELHDFADDGSGIEISSYPATAYPTTATTEHTDNSSAANTDSADFVSKTNEPSADTEEGIARLAKSVHSGRTGRYGETFVSAEDTMTWGKGVLNVSDEPENSLSENSKAENEEDSDARFKRPESFENVDEAKADAFEHALNTATPPAPPTPPVPPAATTSAPEPESSESEGE